MENVTISKPDQFHHEIKTWSRLLDFFKQENTILKNRLAEVVDYRADKEFLVLAEQFQNKFIIKDEHIDELRQDATLQARDLTNSNTALTDIKLIKRQEQLRNELEYFEIDFNKLKNEFNKYLSTGL
jgi:hypothetical protein